MSCGAKAVRMLKCFCGCSELSEDEVKHIYRLNAQETLINIKAKEILHRFLELHRSGDKSEAEQFLDIYEKSEEYLLKKDFILTLDELDELSELGLPYHLERKLHNQIQTGDRPNMERCLRYIQGECRKEIEASEEYSNYKQAVLDKLKSKE